MEWGRERYIPLCMKRCSIYGVYGYMENTVLCCMKEENLQNVRIYKCQPCFELFV